MSLNKIIFAFAIIAIAACGTTKQVEETKEETGEDRIKVDTDRDVIWVNSFKSDCGGAAPIIYSLQTQEGTLKPEGNWDCFYGDIQGFEYELGYIYQLEVAKGVLEGKPTLSMTEMISKERDPNYFRIYDIWAATQMNGEVLEITATRPNMEINLATMKVIGKGMCNQYFAGIRQYTPSEIQFGPIAGTKMMCPDIEQERLFLSLLQETVSYKIKSMTLYFYNADKKEVLRFQKVD